MKMEGMADNSDSEDGWESHVPHATLLPNTQWSSLF